MITFKSPHGVMVDTLDCEEAVNAFNKIKADGKSVIVYPEFEKDCSFPFDRGYKYHKKARKVIDEI